MAQTSWTTTQLLVTAKVHWQASSDSPGELPKIVRIAGRRYGPPLLCATMMMTMPLAGP